LIAFDSDLKQKHSLLPYEEIEALVGRSDNASVRVSRASDVSPVAKIPLKARDLLQVALLRSAEITNAFIRVFNAELFVPLFVLSRAVLETGCLSWDLRRRVSIILESRQKAELHDLDRHLMKSLLGGKAKDWLGDPEQYPAPNVLTLVDRLTKAEHPKLRGFYDVLSEYAHPNFSGMQAAYRVVDVEARESRFVPKPFDAGGLDMPFRGVCSGLGMAVFAVELYERSLPEFAALCEEAIHEGGTWPEDVNYPLRRNRGTAQ
jgi:hypothetical protein